MVRKLSENDLKVIPERSRNDPETDPVGDPKLGADSGPETDPRSDPKGIQIHLPKRIVSVANMDQKWIQNLTRNLLGIRPGI